MESSIQASYISTFLDKFNQRTCTILKMSNNVMYYNSSHLMIQSTNNEVNQRSKNGLI